MTLGTSTEPTAHAQSGGTGTVPSGLNWAAVQQALHAKVGEDDYRVWLSSLAVDKVSGEGLTLSVPTSFIQDWIERNYRDVLTETVHAEIGVTLPIRISVVPVFANLKAPAQVAAAPAAAPEEAVAEDASWTQSLRLDPRYTFASFVEGKSNQFAYAAARRVAEEGPQPGFNPFFLHGGVGLGKTHLMHAIGAEVMARRPKARVLYLSSEQFFNRFVRALRDRNTLTFKDSLRGVDVLMVDDLQFIAGKDATQEEFFHTFNFLTENGKQIILSADRSPHELPNVEDRLKSRLGSGLTVQVHAPEVETRLAILQKKAEDLRLDLPGEVLTLLATTIASNVRELEGALNRLVAASRLMGSELTTDFAREQLADLFRLHTRVVTVDDIQKAVADHFKLRLADMGSPRRAREVARPRQVAMYLCKTLTSKSYPDIGRAFGGRDHTTVIHAVETIEALVTKDAELAENVRILNALLGGKA